METDHPLLLAAEPTVKREHITELPKTSAAPLTPWEMVEPETEPTVDSIESIIERPIKRSIELPAESPVERTADPIADSFDQSIFQAIVQPPKSAPIVQPTKIEPIVERPASVPSPDALMVAATDVEESETETDEEEPTEIFSAPRSKSVKYQPSGGGLFTIPLLCLGIGLIACCILIPAADENRRLVYERENLKRDLDQISHQTDVNDEFLKRVADDPSLSERLAQRQMKMVRQGTSVLDLKGEEGDKQMSPFGLLTLPPPDALPPYQPVGGMLSTVCRNPHGQLYMTGAGLLLIAMGLVLGHTPTDPTVSCGNDESGDSETSESIGD